MKIRTHTARLTATVKSLNSFIGRTNIHTDTMWCCCSLIYTVGILNAQYGDYTAVDDINSINKYLFYTSFMIKF